MDTPVGIASGAIMGIYVVWRIYSYLTIQRKLVGHIPGSTCLFMPLSIPGLVLPSMGQFWNPAILYTWKYRHTLYDEYPIRLFSKTAVVDHSTLVYTSDPEVFQQATTVGGGWQKPYWAMQDMAVLGTNIVTAEGEQWKRFRQISAPAFTQELYDSVWRATVDAYDKIVETEKWNGENSVDISDVYPLTRKLSLHVFLVAGYGINLKWDTPKRSKDGGLSVYDTMIEVCHSILLKSRVPPWMFRLGLIPKLNLVDEAYTSFQLFMQERIASCELEMSKQNTEDTKKAYKGNILSSFVAARHSNLNGNEKLTDEELIGNLFLFIIDAHEALAHALCAALALLAVYPDIQDKVYQQIQNTLGDREPSLNNYDSLDLVLGCLYESLRLYPSAYCLVREATQNTTLRVPRKEKPEIVETVMISKGTQLILDIIGSGYDKHRYPDPDQFNPSRWTLHLRSDEKINSTDDILSWSIGPRACLGRKFASVEAVAFITHIMRNWRIELLDLKDGETREMWRERVLNPSIAIMMTFEKVPLKFVRR